jgi:hypothetical protein
MIRGMNIIRPVKIKYCIMFLFIVCVGMFLNTSQMVIGENNPIQGGKGESKQIPNPESQGISFKSCNFYVQDIDISGSYLYAATSGSGLGVFQITSPGVLGNPVNKTLWGKIDPEAEFHYNDYIILNSIYISGTYAYVSVSGFDTMTGGFKGVSIINIATPMSPGTEVFVEVTADDWGPYGLYVDGNWLYVALGDNGLAIVNVTDPMNPESPIYRHTSGIAVGVCVANNYAYVSCSYWGVAIIDVTDPEVPGAPIYAPDVSDSQQALVSGNYLYIADGADGLSILDITTPASPTHVGSWFIDGTANDLQKSGDYVYLAADVGGITVYNVQTPSNPTVNKSKSCQKDVHCIDISGNFAFVDQDILGVGIISIASPNTFGDDERLPNGSTLKATLTLEGSFYVNYVDGHVKDYISYIDATIKIYESGEIYDWIQVDLEAYVGDDDDIWTYWVNIKDGNGQTLGRYFNIQQDQFWEDDLFVIRVAKQTKYSFQFDGDLEYDNCISHTEYWDVPTQTLYITCTGWETKHADANYTIMYDPQGDLMKQILIYGGIIGAVSVVGIVVVVKKRKSSKSSWASEPKRNKTSYDDYTRYDKKKSKVEDEWGRLPSKPKSDSVDFSDLSKKSDEEDLFKF